MVEKIIHDNNLHALIVRNNFKSEGINFFTPNDFSQQLGYMSRAKGYVINPHVHNPVSREVLYTKEVLFIKSGKVRVDFYTENKDYLESKILYTGDIILLAIGGHGFEVLEDAQIIEVKQGPYAGDLDKTRFSPIPNNLIVLK